MAHVQTHLSTFQDEVELSVSNMQRMSSASARAAEERPVHMPGGEVPSTSGRDEQQAQVHMCELPPPIHTAAPALLMLSAAP